MTATLDMIRGRSNVVTKTNNSGGALAAGDVCVQDTTADEYVTTTTSAASVLKIFVAAEAILAGASGRFYASGFCPLVNPNASLTRGHYVFTHTVAKQCTGSATFGGGAFGVVTSGGTSPGIWLFSQTSQGAGGAGSDTTAIHNNVSGEINGITAKTTPVSGDIFLMEDSAASNAKKKITYGNLVPAASIGFGHVAVSGQTTVDAASAADTLTLVAGTNVTITTNAGAKSATINSSGGGGSVVFNGSILTSLSTPPSAGWTWVNQGTATLTDNTTYQYMHVPSGTGGNNVHAVVRAFTPTARLSAIVKVMYPIASYFSAGICVRNSSSGKIISFGLHSNQGITEFNMSRYSNATTWASEVNTQAEPWASSAPFHMGVKVDGTNILWQLSILGDNTDDHWSTVVTEALATYITSVDQVGIFCYTDNGTYPIGFGLIHWNIY